MDGPGHGYRTYEAGQLRRARLILLLRQTGAGLDAIQVALDADPLALAERSVREREGAARDAARGLQALRRFLQGEETMEFHVEPKIAPALVVLSSTRNLRVDELEKFIIASLRELNAHAVAAGPAFTIYHGPVNEEENGPVEVCLPVAAPLDPPEGMAVRRLAETPVATVRVHGDQAEFPAILGAYNAAFCWVESSGRTPTEPPREVMVSGEEGAWNLEIQLPYREGNAK